MKQSSNAVPQPVVRNGVAVTALFATIDAVKGNPEIANFQFRAANRWQGGDHNRSTIEGFRGACQGMKHARPFEMDNGEPPVLLGADEHANPVEYVLHALVGCLTSRALCPDPVESLHNKYGFEAIVVKCGRHNETHTTRELHRKPFVGRGMGIGVRVSVIGLEDMSRRFGTLGLEEVVAVQDDRQLVLGTSQRHFLWRLRLERRTRKGTDAGSDLRSGKRLAARGGKARARRQEGQRSGGLGTVRLKQSEGVGGGDLAFLRQPLTQVLIGKEIVEEPLNRAIVPESTSGSAPRGSPGPIANAAGLASQSAS